MHNYKQLYLKLLQAANDAITAIEHMNFGTAKELLTKAQQETEEQWLKEAERKAEK